MFDSFGNLSGIFTAFLVSLCQKRCGGSGKGIRLENGPELAIVQSVRKQ